MQPTIFIHSLLKNYLMNLLKNFCLSLFIVLGLMACEKEPFSQEDSISSVVSYVESLNGLSETFFVFNRYFPNNFANIENEELVQITVSPLFPVDSFPKIISLNFGDTGIKGDDNVLRRGKIRFWVNNDWFCENNTHSLAKITFEDYFFNEKRIVGSIDFKADKAEENKRVTWEAKNVEIYIADSLISYFDCSYSLIISENKLLRYLDPFDWELDNNDAFFSATSSNKTPYTVVVEKNLFFNSKCFNGIITSGKICIYTDGVSEISADFGTGECNKTVIIKSGGLYYTINL